MIEIKNLIFSEDDLLNLEVNENEDFVFHNLRLIRKSYAEIERAKNRLEAICDFAMRTIAYDEFEVYSLKRLIKKEHLRIWEISRLIRKYCSLVRYKESDFDDMYLATRKNACVETKLVDKVGSDVVLPDFKINIVNLGFDGISKSDKLTMRFIMTNGDIGCVYETEVGEDVKGIRKIVSVPVKNLRTPSAIGLYNVEIRLSEDDFCYAKYLSPVVIVGASNGSSAVGTAIVGTSVIGGAVR